MTCKVCCCSKVTIAAVVGLLAMCAYWGNCDVCKMCSFQCGGILAILAYVTLKFRRYMKGGKFTSDVTAEGKVVVITGANCGIGRETALELASRGAKVYMACRDVQKGTTARNEIIKESKNKNVIFRVLDLASLQSVRDFATGFKKEEKSLDILINNAGVFHTPLSPRTKEGFEMQIGVNHMGHFLLTHLLLDTLKATPESRIVNVSSLSHSHGVINREDLNSKNSYNASGCYSQSKLANVLFTRELANKLKGTGVTVNALHPGVVETEAGRHLPFVNTWFGKLLLKPLAWLIVKSANEGAQTTLHCALHPDLGDVTGKYFSDCAEKEPAAVAKDDATAKWLWAESEKWTGISKKSN